jgi:hypothetical protein
VTLFVFAVAMHTGRPAAHSTHPKLLAAHFCPQPIIKREEATSKLDLFSALSRCPHISE